MKGLEEYLDKHGYHFTRKLVEDILPLRWNADDIMESAQKRVYYNVTGYTEGDMVYLTHWLYDAEGWPNECTKGRCIKTMLWFAGNYSAKHYFFCAWLSDVAQNKKDFDFTPYI